MTNYNHQTQKENNNVLYVGAVTIQLLSYFDIPCPFIFFSFIQIYAVTDGWEQYSGFGQKLNYKTAKNKTFLQQKGSQSLARMG